jgi:hypothetical protein
MIAPRKLQSLGDAVHAVAAAISSVRSTLNVVANIGIKVEVSGTALGLATRLLAELEDALWLYVRNAATKTTSISSDQADFLFIVLLQPN